MRIYFSVILKKVRIILVRLFGTLEQIPNGFCVALETNLEKKRQKKKDVRDLSTWTYAYVKFKVTDAELSSLPSKYF